MEELGSIVWWFTPSPNKQKNCGVLFWEETTPYESREKQNKTKAPITLLRRPHVNKGAAKGSVQIQKSTNKKYNIYVLHVNVNIYHFIYFYLL